MPGANSVGLHFTFDADRMQLNAEQIMQLAYFPGCVSNARQLPRNNTAGTRGILARVSYLCDSDTDRAQTVNGCNRPTWLLVH